MRERLVIKTSNIDIKVAYIYITIVAILLFFISQNVSGVNLPIYISIFGLIGVTIRKVLPMCLWMFVSIVSIETAGTIIIPAMALLSIPLLIQSKKVKKSDLLLIFFSLFFVGCSFVFGTQTSIGSALTQILVILAFFQTKSCTEEDKRLLMYTIVISGILVAIYIFWQFRSNTFTMVYGRLAYNNNIRALANALSVPMYVFAFNALNTISLYGFFSNRKNMWKIIFYVGLFVVFAAIMLMSGSRGNLIAVLAAVLLLFILTNDIKSRLSYLAILGIVVLVILYILPMLNLDYNLLFNTGSMDGRVQLWKFYAGKVINGKILSLLFGIGPGNVMRVAVGTQFADAYAHSTILDYFFSYGLIGFSFICFIIFKTLKSAIHRNFFKIGLLFLSILLFLPFGSSYVLVFHVLLGICYCNDKE